MRIYLIKEFWDESWREVLPVNNWYEGESWREVLPVNNWYDPQTLQEALGPHTYMAYVVKCNDGKFRKAVAEHFLTEEEWRERQLNQILSLSL